MSAAPASGAAPTAKATSTDAATTPPKDQKPTAALEEDDEFEDFPVEGALRALPLSGSHGSPNSVWIVGKEERTEANDCLIPRLDTRRDGGAG
jgi:hypothetical protein